ncbi:MAG: ribonuclease D [Candidatus Nanoarchaeia archaeon]
MKNKSQQQQKVKTNSYDSPKYTFITTQDVLTEAVHEWKKQDVLAIDLEMENNLHHYGAYISLIQISTREKNWIIDALAFDDLSPVWNIFENAAIQKIFHDVSFDFRILNTQFGCKPKNIFDTEAAAVLLGKESVGLQTLLQEYFDVKKESKFQMADWTKRPIKSAMLDYASKDTIYLIPLRDKLTQELVRAKRYSWAKEEFKAIEEQHFELKHPSFYDLRGLRQFPEEKLGILKELFDLREKLAKKVNRPVHYILNNKRLQQTALHPTKSSKEFAQLKGVHPIVRSQSKAFFAAVQKGKHKKITLPKREIKRFSQEQKKEVELLKEVRNYLEKTHRLLAHNFLTKDHLTEIVASKSFSCLLEWQKKEVHKALEELGLEEKFSSFKK